MKKVFRSIGNQKAKLLKNTLFKNSSWGIISQLSQTIFLSLFFVILARKYPTDIFAKYIIANALYQLVTAFSTMGLSQWFIREFIVSEDKEALISKFLKTQIYFGLGFYLLNIGLAFLLYDEQFTRMLIILMGANVIFDNLINAIKALNIANFEQKKTFIILTIESLLKFLAGCLLFVHPFSIIILSAILIGIRFLSLNLFLNFGSSNAVNLKKLWRFKVSYPDIKSLVLLNWAFVIIGGVSIINWRMSNIIISKVLTAFDVANYEISFKIFSIAQILPVVVSTSVFPLLVKHYSNSPERDFLTFYKKVHVFYLLFGLLAYTFIYSFSDKLIPIAFGTAYLNNAEYTKQMFLTILVFPTALLQANVLITIKLEKLDMLFNIIALVVNLSMCLFGIFYIKSLSIVNYSIFASFFVFHVFQDIVLVRKKIISLISVFKFYVFTTLFIVSYIELSQYLNAYVVFMLAWLLIGIYFLIQRRNLPAGLTMAKNSY
ncbi:oligosaccharide flippase family protein [Mucilaginibacter sp. SP1R1]|uniref:oligosaccharide flippase family protein n=1 Tax=Mucilaginibacter sp. SP1R1 TaxID=2723091 RepID=UPI0016088942|nr:oligosaccharide flippase family protein [Mucilaginibacter sp. SP1R1]MBB6148297.1 O-antigen/teichoic acid export membrane protein [Mucilaginibacter sp. SP1R1]